MPSGHVWLWVAACYWEYIAQLKRANEEADRRSEGRAEAEVKAEAEADAQDYRFGDSNELLKTELEEELSGTELD